MLVRKIGVPWQPELALGAVTNGPSPESFIDEDLAKALGIPERYAQDETARQLEEIERRRKSYCGGLPANCDHWTHRNRRRRRHCYWATMRVAL